MGKFRLLQFNMQFGQIWDAADPDGAPIRLEDALATIKSYDADIILLQEVEKAQMGGVQTQPPVNYSVLEQALEGYEGVFAYPPADSRELPFGIGLAIFSRFPITGSEKYSLPGEAIEFEFEGIRTTPTDRVLLKAEVSLAEQTLTVLNTHLQAYFMIKATSDDFPGQRNKVLEVVEGVEGPLVLAGDFNSAPNEGLVDQFEAVGLTTMQKDQITWKRMPFVLDHIFYNTALSLKGGKVEEVASSDHHALVADFEI